MVRINLFSPRCLSDQHLLAEHVEIMMLIGYTKKNPKLIDIPSNYVLGKGHIKFFKNKLRYLTTRLMKIRQEMTERGFNPAQNPFVSTLGVCDSLEEDYKIPFQPSLNDFNKIKVRLIDKLSKKINWYTYYGEHEDLSFYKRLMENDIIASTRKME